MKEKQSSSREKPLFNNDIAYAQTRLQDSIVRTRNNKLFYVNGLSGKSFAEGHAIGSFVKSRERTNINCSEIEFFPGRLGYCNSPFSERLLFLIRAPMRQGWRQGLRKENVLCIKRGERHADTIGSELFTSISPSIEDTINNVYPSFIESIDLVEEQDKDIAFSKNFAVGQNYKIYYRAKEVGFLTKEDRIKLHDKFLFVKEELEEIVGNERILFR